MNANTAVNIKALREAFETASEIFIAAAELDPEQQGRSDLLQALDNQLQIWQGISEQAAETGFAALVDIITVFSEFLYDLRQKNTGLGEEHWETLDLWYSGFSLLFDRSSAPQAAQQLITCLRHQSWVNPLPEEDADELLRALLEYNDTLTGANKLSDGIALQHAQCIATDEQLIEDDATAGAVMPDSQQSINFDYPTFPVNPKLVNLIGTEFSFFVAELAESMEQAIVADEQAYLTALQNKRRKFSNLQKACETVGLFGLKRVFDHLEHNIVAEPAGGYDFLQEAKLFKSVALLIMDYLDNISDPVKGRAITTFLSKPGWRKPFSIQHCKPLAELLNVVVVGGTGPTKKRSVAKPEDVSLAIPEDVNQALIDSLLHELPILTENFSKAVHHVLDESTDGRCLREAQRIAHTLKGAGATAGIVGVTNFTHRLEDILEQLAELDEPPPPALSQILIDAADCLEEMGEALKGEGQVPENAVAVLQSILDWSYRIEEEGGFSESANNVTLDSATYAGDNNKPISDNAHQPQVHAELDRQADAKITVASVLIEDVMQSIDEQSILGEQLKSRTDQIIGDAKLIHNVSWQMHELSSEIDRLINIQSYNLKQHTADFGEFDALEMDQYNEFHACANRMAEVAADIREMNAAVNRQLNDLKTLFAEQSALQKDNRELVQQLRLIPASSIVARCQRIVRQAARMTGKDVQLTVSGEQTLIDKETLDDLIEPLMHLLRNSVDHGIESEQARLQSGKSVRGHIQVVFSKQGNDVLVSVEDDGSGLDKIKIVNSAISKKLLQEHQAAHLSDNEITQLILTPGFSTSETITQASGRGIGMDVIHNRVLSMKGTFDLQSTPGKGLKTIISVPLLLAATQALLVRTGNQVFAISEHGFKHLFCSGDFRLVELNDQLRYQFEDENYRALHLNQLLGLPPIHEAGNRKLPAILVEDRSGTKTVVLIDEIVSSQELIVKSFSTYVPAIPGVLGAAILPSGDVAVVLDIYELLSGEKVYHFDTNVIDLPDSMSGLPKVLVVDDSLSARRATSQLLTDSGFEVDTAIDGLDAIDKMDKQMPDIVLLDLEMPRMNGVELSAHIRNREDTADLPIIMITSRSTEKHREQARAAGVSNYLTKPFLEDELIGAIGSLLAEERAGG